MEVKNFDESRKLDERFGGRGLSPFIASVLTILFGVLMLAIVLGVVNPTFKRAQDSSVMSDAFQNLDLLNSAIKEVASESQGSKRTVSISVSDGEYSTNETTDSLIFIYEPSKDMRLSGTKGDIEIQHGSVFLDFFNWYVEDDVAAPVWTNISGNWTVSNYKYKGEEGLAYHNLSTIENYKFSGKIYNTSGTTGGQIIMLPTNPERLVGFWALDNYTGNNAYDWSGNGNNGTLPAASDFPSVGNSTSGWQSSSNCKAGVSCLMFDGSNDYVEIADSNLWDFAGKGATLEVWFKALPKQTDQWPRFLDHFVGGGSAAGWRLGLDVDGDQIEFMHNGTENAAITSTGTYNDSTWHHVVVTLNTTHAVMYIDGIQAETDGYSSLNDHDKILYIGGSGSNNNFNGTIDEVKIWNVALTDDEITAEYELSAKKIIESGSQEIAAKTPKGAIVLINPDGVTSFDNIKVSGSQKEQKLIIPYSKIDLNGTLRIGKGNHKVTIKHMGANTTLGEPIIQVTS